MVRFLLKRKFKKQKFPKWIGRTMSMNPVDARRFSATIKNYEGMMAELDKIRLDAAKAKQAQRKKAADERIPFEDITPHGSPAPE